MILHSDGCKIAESASWQAGKLKTAKKFLETHWSWMIRPSDFPPESYMEVETDLLKIKTEIDTSKYLVNMW